MIKNLFQKKPSEIASAVRAVLAALVLLKVFDLDAEQLAGIVIALESALYLFTSSQTVSVGTLHEANTFKTDVLRAAAVNTDPNDPRTVTMETVTTSTAAPTNFEPTDKRPGWTGGKIGVLLLVALVGGSVGCASRDGVVTQPHVVAAQYGTDVMQVTIALQETVIAYTKANGGNATTDAIMGSIRDRVIPTARQLSSTLKAYDAITDPGLKASRIEDIDRLLVSLVTAYGEVSSNKEIATLASEAALASARIRELVLAIRLAIREASGTVTAPAPSLSQGSKYKTLYVS